MFVIKDWAGNEMFGGDTFDSFEDAWDFIFEFYGHLSDEDFDEQTGELFAEEIGGAP